MTQKWNVQYTTAIENLYQVCREDGSVVAKIKAVSGTDEDRATARLIAAAPAMLGVLQAIKDAPDGGTAMEIIENDVPNIIRQAAGGAA